MCYHYEDYDCNRCMGIELDYEDECFLCNKTDCICDAQTDAYLERDLYINE